MELALAIASRSALEDETSCLRFSGGCALPSSAIEPIRTDFKGYEGKFVALDARTGKIVLADEDPRVVLEKAKGRNHVVVHGRVPHADEPIYVASNSIAD